MDIFGTLRNPRIYNRAIFRTPEHLEPEASSKASRTCKMIMHIQSPLPRGIFRNIDAYSPHPSLDYSKCSFKSIQEKKLQNVSLRFLLFLCFWWNNYRSPLVPAPLPLLCALKHFWLRTCTQVVLFLQNALS